MAGDELKEFRQGARTTEAANVYISYEKLLAGANSIDYGDLINLPIELLQSRPDVAAMLRRQYPYVLADEYQDVNRACARLLQLLAGPDGRNLWVVGDHRQSIYRFRGASPANMSGFQIDYPAGVRQELANNYRSCAPIVSLCSAAARCMHGANHAQSNDGWRSARAELEAGSAPRISMAVTDSDEAQAEGIANRIADFRCQGIPYSEQAILCRTHYQANALAKLLAKCGAPVHYAQGLLDRPEARDLLAVLQASIPSKSSVIALQRVATISDVGLSPIQGALLVRLTAETGLSALDAIQRSEVEDVFGEIPGFQKLRQLLHVLKDEIDPARCLERFVFHESSYLADLLGAEGASAPRDLAEQAQICAIRQTIELARMFTGSRRRLDPASAPHADMRVSFLEYVRRLMASGSQPALNLGDDLGGFDSVAMITVHAAKGLEFPVVFVPNLSEGRFPPRSREPLIAEPPGMAQDNSGDGDEQCLFFVAISRAREHLVLSRSTSSGDATLAPSRLITLIDGGLHELGITETRWADTQTRDAPEREVHADVNPVGKPVFTSSQLTAYLQCPRQYYYSRLGLDMAVDHPATVQQVPKTLQAALTRERIRPVRQPNRLIARFDTVHICVEADMIACDVEGRLVIAKHLMGKPQDRDQADPLLALYRRAADDSAPSQPSRIEIHYLSTGDRRVVARSKKYEPGRLLKFVEAAAALEHGEYPARPAEPGLCARCPYLVACPT